MWFTAAAQLIGQEMQATPLDTRNPYAAQAADSSRNTMFVLGGMALLMGGAAYFLLRTPSRSLGRRSRR